MSDRATTAGGPGLVVQIYGLLGGMAAYALHLLLGISLVPLSCALGSTWPNHLLTVVVVVAVLGAALAAWRTWSASRDGVAEVIDRRRAFLGVVGLMLNAVALLVVTFAEVPLWFLDPCLP